jgi:hypothetical protein
VAAAASCDAGDTQPLIDEDPEDDEELDENEELGEDLFLAFSSSSSLAGDLEAAWGAIDTTKTPLGSVGGLLLLLLFPPSDNRFD